MTKSGLFGKLPSHGDFVQSGLTRGFIEPWDDWLRQGIGHSRDVLGVGWLEAYLTSPAWNFVVAAGICGPMPHAGVLLPSVDMSGRYFPLTLAQELPIEIQPITLITESAWYRDLEEIGRLLLAEEMHLNDVPERLAALAWSNDHPVLSSSGAKLDLSSLDFRDHQQLTKAVLDRAQVQFTLFWSKEGSECIGPSMLVSAGLPSLSGFPAMLSGKWGDYGWEEIQSA